MTVESLSRRSVLLFALAALLLFLGARGLNEPDEGRYAEIARETAAGAGWLIPKLNGFAHLQKPPLIYWITAVSIRLFGVNEWSARLPSALAAFGAVWLTMAIGQRLFDRATGVLAGLILVSSAEFFVLARTLTPDMTMTFFVCAAIYCFVRFASQGERRWAWLYFIAMGLGFLVKGPMALVVPIGAAAAWQWNSSRRAGHRPLPWIPGLLLTFAIALSWFICLALRYPELFRFFWHEELVARFLSKQHGRAQPFWFFLPVLLAGLLPWSFLLLAPAREAWRRLRKRAVWSERSALLAGWAVVPFVILSCSGSKLPTYILPIYPAFALAFAYGIRRRAGSPRWVLPLAFATVALWLAGTLVAALPRANDALRQQCSVRSLARIVAARPDFAGARLFVCGVRAHGFEYYTQRLVSATEGESDTMLKPDPLQWERLIPSPEDCQGIMLASQPAYGLVRANAFQKYFTPARWNVLGQAGEFMLIGTNGTKKPVPALVFPLPQK